MKKKTALPGGSNQGLEIEPFPGWQRRLRLSVRGDRSCSRGGVELPQRAGGRRRGGVRGRGLREFRGLTIKRLLITRLTMNGRARVVRRGRLAMEAV